MDHTQNEVLRSALFQPLAGSSPLVTKPLLQLVQCVRSDLIENATAFVIAILGNG